MFARLMMGEMKMADSPERPTTGVTAFLTIREGRGTEALAFYEAAFGAEVTERNLSDDGKRLMQAGMKLNNGWVMLSDDFPEYTGHPAPPAEGVGLHLQVPDADAAFARAIAAGAEVRMPLADMFWGDRYGQLKDPFGHLWSIAHALA